HDPDGDGCQLSEAADGEKPAPGPGDDEAGPDELQRGDDGEEQTEEGRLAEVLRTNTQVHDAGQKRPARDQLYRKTARSIHGRPCYIRKRCNRAAVHWVTDRHLPWRCEPASTITLGCRTPSVRA